MTFTVPTFDNFCEYHKSQTFSTIGDKFDANSPCSACLREMEEANNAALDQMDSKELLATQEELKEELENAENRAYYAEDDADYYAAEAGRTQDKIDSLRADIADLEIDLNTWQGNKDRAEASLVKHHFSIKQLQAALQQVQDAIGSGREVDSAGFWVSDQAAANWADRLLNGGSWVGWSVVPNGDRFVVRSLLKSGEVMEYASPNRGGSRTLGTYRDWTEVTLSSDPIPSK